MAAKKIDSDTAYRSDDGRCGREREDGGVGDDGRWHSDDDLINLQGVERGTHSSMEVDTTGWTPEPLEDVQPISPAPADEEKSESETEQEVGEEAALDMGDDIADDEGLLYRSKSLTVILL